LICTVCCGSKRLKEIPCPSDCAYLASAREHPPAAVLREQQRDLGLLMNCLRDLSERQSRLFVLVAGIIARHEPLELQSLLDEDVSAAVSALAATYETAVRGVIYEHQPKTLASQRLAGEIKAVLEEAGKSAGTAFDRDVAVLLRRIEATVQEVAAVSEPGNRRSFLDLLGRTLAKGSPSSSKSSGDQKPNLIVL
jgi:hypothetical protein